MVVVVLLMFLLLLCDLWIEIVVVLFVGFVLVVLLGMFLGIGVSELVVLVGWLNVIIGVILLLCWGGLVLVLVLFGWWGE